MAVKLLSESMEATITDDDQIRIDAILAFWFEEKELSAPQIDGRMDLWFGEDPVFDHEIEKEFAQDIERAAEGKLDHWAKEARGRLALILLLDQFRRNVFRNSAEAFSGDKQALKLCVEGAMEKKDKGLSPIERVFFYMPLQHAEDRAIQARSVAAFEALAAEPAPAALAAALESCADYAVAHRDIVERFGRFPHRNRILGRESTRAEREFLAAGGASFGQ